MNRLALAFCCASLLAFALAGPASAQTYFVGNSSSNTITSLDVGANGVPTPTGAPAAATGVGPRTLNVTPNGSFLTQANYDPTNSLATWAIGTNNALSISAGSPLATLPSPSQSAISPNGKFLYLTSGYNDAGINAYAIGANGSLTLIENEFTNSNGSGIAITPNGRYLYACTSTSGLYAFSIAADGSLSPLAGHEWVPGISNCLGLAITPDGQTLIDGEYVGATTDLDQIRSSRIAADGSATSIDTEIVGFRPEDLATSPSGKFVVSFDYGAGGTTSPGISGTAINADGTLTHKTTYTIPGVPGQFLTGGALSPDGKYAYTALRAGGANTYGFNFSAEGGVSAIAGMPFASGGTLNSSANQAIAFKPAQGPVARISSSGSGATRSFSAAGSTDVDSAIGSYLWDFGDGTTTTTPSSATTHQFTRQGIFDVTVRAVATDNCQTDLLYSGRFIYCNPGSTASMKVDALAPTISGLKLSPSKFKVNKRAKAPKIAKKVATGSFAKYRLSDAGTLTFQVEKPTKGRTVGKSCVKATKSNKKKKACTRYVATGKSWKLTAAAGTRKTAFSGKVGSKALKAGKYRLSIVATDALGNAAAPKTAKFTIVR